MMLRILLALACAAWSFPAWAGPPYDTDDPETTEPGHWELYAISEIDGRGGDFEGTGGFEVNYGAGSQLQLSLGVPLAVTRERGIGISGLGDVEVSVKYRFVDHRRSGFQLAAFPAVTLPTATNGLGADRVTAAFPVWAQQDLGKWSLFGGGGYAINPGVGNRNFWSGGMAATREVSERVTLGLEATREGPTSLGDRPTNTLGLGAVIAFKPPFSILLRAGPAFEDGGGKANYHLYAALGLNF